MSLYNERAAAMPRASSRNDLPAGRRTDRHGNGTPIPKAHARIIRADLIISAVMIMALRSLSRRPPMTISYDELSALAGNHAMVDTACPLCGPGRRSLVNRKRRVLRIWHNERGFASYYCARCGERGWARENQVIAASRSRGVREQTGLRPLAQLAPHRTADLDNAKRSEVALAIWQSSTPAQGTPVETYLASRGIHLTPSDALRFHAGLKHPSGGIWPAMVALVTNGADGHAACDPPHVPCPRRRREGADRSSRK